MDYLIQGETLENIADAARAVTGAVGTKTPGQIATMLNNYAEDTDTLVLEFSTGSTQVEPVHHRCLLSTAASKWYSVSDYRGQVLVDTHFVGSSTELEKVITVPLNTKELYLPKATDVYVAAVNDLIEADATKIYLPATDPSNYTTTDYISTSSRVALQEICFRGCKVIDLLSANALRYVDMPNCIWVGERAFDGDISLETVKLHVNCAINDYSFCGTLDPSEKTLYVYLMDDESVNEYNGNIQEYAFNEDEGGGGGGGGGCGGGGCGDNGGDGGDDPTPAGPIPGLVIYVPGRFYDDIVDEHSDCPFVDNFQVMPGTEVEVSST